MRTPSLVVGLAAVFAGMTALLVVLAFAFELALLVVAVPLGAATYGFWYHASGRLQKRVRRQRAGARRRATESGPFDERGRGDGRGRGDERGGFGAGPREEWTGPRANGRGFEGRVGADGRRGRRANSRVAAAQSGPSVAEAYDVLGLDPGADTAAIKQAYRSRVKEVHPYIEGGDERAFKRVNEAYERLVDRS